MSAVFPLFWFGDPAINKIGFGYWYFYLTKSNLIYGLKMDLPVNSI